MKCISLWQPYASLLFCPFEVRKHYETRPNRLGLEPGEQLLSETCGRMNTKAIRQHNDCQRLVDLYDDCSDGPEFVLVPCHHCAKRGLPAWAKLDRDTLSIRSGLALGASRCQHCNAVVCVAITGFPVSGGGDMSRGGPPNSYTRSGRGPSPGHLPGHNGSGGLVVRRS